MGRLGIYLRLLKKTKEKKKEIKKENQKEDKKEGVILQMRSLFPILISHLTT
jgi:hypothetical protein